VRDPFLEIISVAAVVVVNSPVSDFTLGDVVCRNHLYISDAGGYLNDSRDENRVGDVQLHCLLNTKKKHLRKRNRRENTMRREGGTCKGLYHRKQCILVELLEYLYGSFTLQSISRFW